jgi:hypothetical protein
MIKLLLVGLGLLSCQIVSAQQENVWAIGTNAGINFTGGSPQFITTSMVADEACASICGANGRLLFYTEGTYVWDSLGNVMPNGSELTNEVSPGPGITTTWSTAQGALIVPMPDSVNKFYLFSLTAETGYLYYSVLDMTLHNGLGDIVPGRKGILIDSLLSERMTAVLGNDCNIWLLTCSRTPNFKAYEITASGISATPIVSATGIGGSLGLESMGCMVVSPDRTKIAATTCLPVTDMISAALFNFDVNTGLVSSPLPLVLDTAADAAFAYSVCFSPDNSKLYVNFLSSEKIDQFNLSSGNVNVIPGTRTYIGPSGFSSMKSGPNGKLYFLTNIPGSQPNQVLTNHALGCISSPNLAGIACLYNPQVLLFPAQTAPTFGWDYGTGLPNVVVQAIKAPSPVIVANGLQLSTTIVYNAYQWYINGTAIPGATNSTYTAVGSGDYTVMVTGDHNCTATSALYHVNITGISNTPLHSNQVSIYPNPTSSEIHIQSAVPVTAILWSINGKVLEQIEHATIIKIGEYADGIYWLGIKDKNGVLIKAEKIVKRK